MTKAKRSGRAAQVLECLPSKHEALNSTPSIEREREKKREREERQVLIKKHTNKPVVVAQACKPNTGKAEARRL
jgi:hypothetical protein